METVICIKEATELCDDDEEFMKEMVRVMRGDIISCENLLAKAFMENNPVQVREVAHRVKGQAAMLAAKDLREKSKTVEDAAKVVACTKMEYLLLMLSMKDFVRCTRDI